MGRTSGSFAHGTASSDMVREIAVLKKLDHPNVVKLIEVRCCAHDPMAQSDAQSQATSHVVPRSYTALLWAAAHRAVSEPWPNRSPCDHRKSAMQVETARLGCALTVTPLALQVIDDPLSDSLLLVMEHVAGGSLEQPAVGPSAARRWARLPEPLVLHYVQEVCQVCKMYVH